MNQNQKTSKSYGMDSMDIPMSVKMQMANSNKRSSSIPESVKQSIQSQGKQQTFKK